MLTGKVKKESKKAVLFKAIGTWKGECWWPKSQVNVVSNSDFDYLNAPEWLISKKIESGELNL